MSGRSAIPETLKLLLSFGFIWASLESAAARIGVWDSTSNPPECSQASWAADRSNASSNLILKYLLTKAVHCSALSTACAEL
jgi:hypothetical protein